MKPDILILGFQKCGTTSLYNYILADKDVISAYQKEIDVLTEPGCELSQFLYYFPKKKTGKRTINASHQTGFVPEGFANFKKYFPPPKKIVVIMRNPIDRAFSHYNYDKQIGLLNAPLTFEDYVDLELKIISRISNIEDVREVYEKTCLYSRYGMAITRGIYYIFIKEYLENGYDVYPVFLENLNNDFDNELKGLTDFLDLNIGHSDWPSSKVYNRGKKKDEMSWEIRGKLNEFYQPYNQRLFELINKEIDWK